MNIQQILNESTWGNLPNEITKKIFNIVFDKIKTGKKFSVEITKFFPNNKIPIYFMGNKNHVDGSNAEVIINDINYIIRFYRDYNADIAADYDEEIIEEAYFDTIEHEVIHILDFLRAKGKSRISNLKKEYGTISRWNQITMNNDNPKESLKAYYKNVNEFNRLLNQVVRYFKEHKRKLDEKIKVKEDMIRFIKAWEGEETSEAFNEDNKLYKALILRLNREGVLPKGFK